jgi:alpha-D-xyloside xylohydrolase
MLLEFPDDPASDTLDRQYMLGGALLVAPVLSFDGTVDYYLPAGRWTHLLTGELVMGGGWRREQYGYLSLPLFVRPHSAIVLGGNDQRPDYDYTDGFTLHVCELAEGAPLTTVIPAADGAPAVTFSIARTGPQISVRWIGAPMRWRLLLSGIAAGATVVGGTAAASSGGLLVTPSADVAALTVTLAT